LLSDLQNVYNASLLLCPYTVSTLHAFILLEIEKNDYDNSKNMLMQKDIAIEKETVWDNGSGSIYFRDPAGNLVEFITKGNWPVKDG
jgi:catechol 2,3-dioxygenase-like lactoylglutathione lyase family enzyme